MARKPKKVTAKVGSTHETAIIFTKKSVLEDLAEAKRQTKKRTQSLAGTYGEKVAKAVENEHLDRKAFSMAMQLEAMDDEKLHLTYHNLLFYCESLGVTKRATAQEEMFGPGETGEPVGRFSDGDGDEKEAPEVKPSTVARGRGARAVATEH